MPKRNRRAPLYWLRPRASAHPKPKAPAVLHSAPRTADTWKTLEGEKRSEMRASAYTSVPTMKPNWTAVAIGRTRRGTRDFSTPA